MFLLRPLISLRSLFVFFVIGAEKLEPENIKLDTALCRLLHDDDHSVRMHCVPVLPRLFQVPAAPSSWPRASVLSAGRRKRQHELPPLAAWDTCLVPVRREQHLQLFEKVEHSAEAMCSNLVRNKKNTHRIHIRTGWSIPNFRCVCTLHDSQLFICCQSVLLTVSTSFMLCSGNSLIMYIVICFFVYCWIAGNPPRHHL